MKHPIRILLVEDEYLVAKYLEMGLQQKGYEVCQHVTKGEDAVLEAKNKQLDLILMDIRLPGEIDGLEAARKIRAFSDIPIIFMTGYSDPSLMESAKDINPLEFCIKPIRIGKLISIIDSHFS